MMESTLHLAGLWIGADISNTPHSKKPVLPLSKEHGSQVKDQGGRQCCHNKHKKFPYRPTRDVSLLSGHASYDTRIAHILLLLHVHPSDYSSHNSKVTDQCQNQCLVSVTHNHSYKTFLKPTPLIICPVTDAVTSRVTEQSAD